MLYGRFALAFMLLLSTALAADKDLAGSHAGQWKSTSSGNTGAIRFTLQPGDGGVWKCDLTFTYNGADIGGVMREVRVQESKIDITYDSEVEGTSVRVHLVGEWKGTEFQGKYDSALPDGSPADNGTW